MIFQTRLDKFIFILKPLWQASRERYIGHARTRHHRRTGLARKDAQAPFAFGPSIVSSHTRTRLTVGPFVQARPTASSGKQQMAEGGGETQIRFRRQRDDALGLTNEDDLFITKIAISFGSGRAQENQSHFPQPRLVMGSWRWSCRPAGRPESQGRRAATVSLHVQQNYSPCKYEWANGRADGERTAGDRGRRRRRTTARGLPLPDGGDS